VSYVKLNDHQFIELYGPVPDEPASGLLQVCYEADDIETLWNRFIAQGLYPPPSRKARAGNLLFMIRDREGQGIEFTQYRQGSLHFEDRGKHLGQHRASQHLVRVAIPVRDPESERRFYTQKLGFEDHGSDTVIRLNVPGKPSEEVGIQKMTTATKPRVVFEVPSRNGCATDLRSRGFAILTEDDDVSVVDPDGTVVTFAESASHKAR
jgi:hypothetical protein